MGLDYKSNKIKNNICHKTNKAKNVYRMKKPNIENATMHVRDENETRQK
jgi:hypothetical protein